MFAVQPFSERTMQKASNNEENPTFPGQECNLENVSNTLKKFDGTRK